MLFEEPYFKDSLISNYRDYTQKKYNKLCEELISVGIHPEHTIVDFGCATGALIYEFLQKGYGNVCGTDVSFWAINYGRSTFGLTENQLQYLNYSLLESGADWLICLDVLEHMGDSELQKVLGIIQCDKLIIRVPVSATEGGPYVLDVSRNDKTHIQCHTKPWWLDLLSPYAALEALLRGRDIHDSPGVLAAILKWQQ